MCWRFPPQRRGSQLIWSSLTTLSEPLIHHRHQQTDTDTQRPTLKRTTRAEGTGREGGAGARRGEISGNESGGKDNGHTQIKRRRQTKEGEGGVGGQMLLIWKPKDIFQHVEEHGNKDEQILAETHIMCPQWQSAHCARGKWASLMYCTAESKLPKSNSKGPIMLLHSLLAMLQRFLRRWGSSFMLQRTVVWFAM